MHVTLFRLACATAVTLFLALPAYAQSDAGPRPPVDNWSNESFERQDMREEMEQIRKEHEDIEVAHEQLQGQCHGAKDAEAATCEQERQALHDRREKLHERVHQLHERIAAARAAHGTAALPPPAEHP